MTWKSDPKRNKPGVAVVERDEACRGSEIIAYYPDCWPDEARLIRTKDGFEIREVG